MTTVAALPHQLTRTIDIAAPRDVVFRYFTDPARWASWWGAGSDIDARPGGRMLIRYPNAVEAVGEVLDIQVPERIVFTYGYATGAPIPAGGSRVTIALTAIPRGTRVRLVHEFADAALPEQHEQGWRYQLSLFANVVTNEIHRDADAIADAWFEAWRETDPAARSAQLSRIAVDDVRVHDRFTAVEGIEEVSRHIAGAQRFMPGVTLARTSPARHCQGTVLVDWTATGLDGQGRGTGTNVFRLGPDGRIESVTGFWAG